MSIETVWTECNPDTVAVGDRLEPMVKRPTEVQLFRYCAVGWNSHRIHYDLDYAKSEGYPDVLVQSHLHGAFFTSFCFDWAGSNGRVDRLAYSVRRFATPGDELTFEGMVTALEEVDGGVKVTLELREMRYSDETVCSIADADVFIPRPAANAGLSES